MRPAQLKNKGSNRLGLTFALYSSYGWGVPFIVVVIGQIFDHIKQLPNYIIRPNFGLRSCWFGSKFFIDIFKNIKNTKKINT